MNSPSQKTVSGPRQRVLHLIENVTAAIASDAALSTEINDLRSRKSAAENGAEALLARLAATGGTTDIAAGTLELTALRAESEVVAVVLAAKEKILSASDVPRQAKTAAVAVRDVLWENGKERLKARIAELLPLVRGWSILDDLPPAGEGALAVLANHDDRVRACVALNQDFQNSLEWGAPAADLLKLMRAADDFIAE